jgi:hypothetical protein
MEITANLIQKYSKYSVPQLRIKAGNVFRKWVRERDAGQRCICCGSLRTSDASHFYSAGHYPELEFNEDNCHLGCASCNRYNGGNLLAYRVNLVKKIGSERVEVLENTVAMYRKIGYHHDRIRLIEVIETYKNKPHG